MIRRLRTWLRLFGLSERGLALVEFAIALPVLLLLYLGGWQLSDAIACNRKITITARAIADLTSQYASLSPGQATSILNAATQTMYPYSISNYGANVSELYTDNNGVTRVMQSCANGTYGYPYPIGYVFPLPAAMVSNNTFLILVSARYIYTPVASLGMSFPIMGTDIYMSPRISSSVNWPTC